MIWILYARFEAPISEVAHAERRRQKLVSGLYRQLCSEIKQSEVNGPGRIDEVGSREELLACVNVIKNQGSSVHAWYVVGVGTPYGPLLGSPEKLDEISPFEWIQLRLPFAEGAEARFYMDGSDAWMAPFAADAFNITAYGYRRLTRNGPSGERAFPPGGWNNTADYDPIAPLYAAAFSDITVRRDECRWIKEKIGRHKPEKILDIGCGNGALLAYLSAEIKQGVGVDVSRATVDIAARAHNQRKNLSFSVIKGPFLPFDAGSFNMVVSLLSFRYLDWDPILKEIKRVLAPGGHLLIVDMLASSPKLYEWPALFTDKVKNIWYLRNHQRYKAALQKLVTHPDWRKMINRHPMHTQNEFIWYLKSRFPEAQIRILNRGLKAKIICFDSGPV